MKRFILIAMAAASVFASCSKTSVVVPDDEAWVNDESLPVPVTFSAPGLDLSLTKAIVNGTIEGSVMNGLDIGVFGLATVDGVPAWSDNADGVLINNRRVTTGEDGSVTFDPKVYYPSDNDLNYSFYAYYPYNGAQDNGNSYSVNFTIGYTDVLWAEEHAISFGTDPRYEGFNAEYCRYVKKIGRTDLMPALNFQHLLTALRFVAKAAADLDNITVYRVVVKDVNTKGVLEVAGPDAGTMTFSEPGERPLKLTADANTSILDVAPTVAGAELGTVILEPMNTVTVEVTLKLDNNTSNTVTASLNGNFTAGHRYTLTLTVNSPEEVEISTSLDPWVDEGGSGSTIG